MENQRKRGRGYKKMQRKSLESKEYSESKVSGRLHQKRDLEVRKCGKTCRRGSDWSRDINDGYNVSCAISSLQSNLNLHLRSFNR